MITKVDFLNDFLITIPLFVWVMFVIKYLARWVYDLAVKKNYPPDSATYFGRKIVHIFGAGFITLSIPFLFREPFLPFLSALILAIYTWLPHKKDKLYPWFQIKNDFKDSPITLKWFDLEQVGYYDLSLIDLDTNQTIDIYNTADYTFELEKGGIRHFKLIAEVNANKGRFFKK